MATVFSDRVYTPEDLLRMPDGERFELINGQLVEPDLSGISNWIAGLLLIELGNFVLAHQLGAVLPETQYQCFPDDPNRIRKPDVSFIHRSRLNADLLNGYVKTVPDLAVEVISEHDTVSEVETKVNEYLAAGVKLIWVLNPANKSVCPGSPAIGVSVAGS